MCSKPNQSGCEPLNLENNYERSFIFTSIILFYDHLLLRVPNVMTATYGQRTFSYCAPKLWNSLPKSLKESETATNFKKELKTFLFGDYFR